MGPVAWSWSGCACFSKVNFQLLDNCSFTRSVGGDAESHELRFQFPHWSHPALLKKQKVPSPRGPSGCPFMAPPPDSHPLLPNP